MEIVCMLLLKDIFCFFSGNIQGNVFKYYARWEIGYVGFENRRT